MLVHSIAELIGNTPLFQAKNFAQHYAPQCQLLTKLESFNSSGSVKDRLGLALIDEAERAGTLKPGAVIIEPTSGNTGIGLATVGHARGYDVWIVMPDSVSRERRTLIQSYGAKLFLTPGALGMSGSVAYANQLAEANPGAVILGQFDNPANPDIHYRTTGPELWQDADGKIDVFVAGIGTGGTITGMGRYLKEQNPAIEIIGVEPARAPFFSCGQSGPHGIQGIGAGFMPKVLDLDVVDRIVQVTDEDAIATAQKFTAVEGLFVGISSGAALSASVAIANEDRYAGKTIATLLPDSGDRYLTTALAEFPEIETTPVEL